MSRLAWLLPFTLASGCTSMQEKFCSLIEPDSYVLVSIAGCETMQLSFDYDPQTDFSALESYAWVAAPDTRPGDPAIQGDAQLDGWVTDAVDAELAEKGFRRARQAPDVLVSYEVAVEMRGTLSLTFVRADSGQRIWRGTSNDEAHPARNRNAWEKRVRTAVRLLLERFPPSAHE